MFFKKTLIASVVMALVGTAQTATAADPSAAMLSYVRDSVMSALQDPSIVKAVKDKNQNTAGLSADEIIALDTNWRAQVGASESERPLINAVLQRPESEFLSQQVAQSEGLITEMFVMDARGLNVAASSTTSDYWQGDEAKFQQTYDIGPDAVHVSEIELDASTSAYQSQVSFTLVDPDTGEAIGAVTVGLNASRFF